MRFLSVFQLCRCHAPLCHDRMFYLIHAASACIHSMQRKQLFVNGIMERKHMRSRKKSMRVRLKVKQYAELQGMTKTRLSRLADLNYRTIDAMWTDEPVIVTLNTLLKVAHVLNVSVNELYEEV